MAGSIEQRQREMMWSFRREMPNINHLNGEGQWSVYPRFKPRRFRVKRFNLPVLLTINRGPPSAAHTEIPVLSLSHTRLAFIHSKGFLFAIALLLLLLAVAPLNADSVKKVNCPENAEQVMTDEQGFKHWKIEDVWYSNRPLEPFYDKIDTIYWDDIRMNPFFQPNDSNLVWYGSGDVDSNKILNENDLTLIQSGISNDQADIDGDGIPGTSTDAELFSKYLSGDTSLIQHQWNFPNISPDLKKEWVDKMFAIDTTSEIPYTSDWMCGDFSKQTIINFHGFGEANEDTSLARYLSSSGRYDLSQNGRFDLPVYDVNIRGPPHHAINAILLGEDPLNWENWYFIEPQNDKQVIIGDWNMSDSSTVQICHTFFAYSEYFQEIRYYQAPFIEFKLTDGVPNSGVPREGHVILERPEVNSIKPASNSLETFVLNSNYPNPFNSNTKIDYSLPNFDKVKLQVYDITGKLVQTLVDENQNSGKYSVNFDGSNLPSGIYVYQLQVGSYSQTKKMVILK